MVHRTLLTFFSTRISVRRRDIRWDRTLLLRNLVVPRGLVRSPHIHYLLIQRTRNPQVWEPCVILICYLRFPFPADLSLTRILPPWVLLLKPVVPLTPVQDIHFHLQRLSPLSLSAPCGDYTWRPNFVIYASISPGPGYRYYKRDLWIYPPWSRRVYPPPRLITCQ